MLEARRGVIRDRLTVVRRRMDAVVRRGPSPPRPTCVLAPQLTKSLQQTANAKQVEEEIFAKLQAALQQLKEEKLKKTSILEAERLELQRQLQQIGWAE